MAKRLKSVNTEEKAVLFVERLFNDENWQVNRLHRDFGMDLHVKLFEKAPSFRDTPWEFYVQVKGTEKLEQTSAAAKFVIDVDHLRLWSEVALPVLLIVVDVTTEAGYWLPVQRYTADLDEANADWRLKTDSLTISIPRTNEVTAATVTNISRYVRAEILYVRAQKV